jgi:hypothetical protein
MEGEFKLLSQESLHDMHAANNKPKLVGLRNKRHIRATMKRGLRRSNFRAKKRLDTNQDYVAWHAKEKAVRRIRPTAFSQVLAIS